MGSSPIGGSPIGFDKAILNYFGSTFDSYNIHRLLVATKTAVISSVLAANFPGYDLALILVSEEANSINLFDLDEGIYLARIYIGNNLITSGKIIRN